jgi:hypothetical protein
MPLQIVVVSESYQNDQNGDVSNHLTDIAGVGGGECTGGDECVNRSEYTVELTRGPPELVQHFRF